MHDFPHRYRASCTARAEGPVAAGSPGLATLETYSPPEFGGPEGYWSPETLLTASVVDCFVLTFRAIARASQCEWLELECDAEGTLERVDRVIRFTRFDIRARLRIPADGNPDRAERLLQKAEENCLITSSMSAEVHLGITVESG